VYIDLPRESGAACTRWYTCRSESAPNFRYGESREDRSSAAAGGETTLG
jgi:hypothetical protein